jgi:hypothetical protein
MDQRTRERLPVLPLLVTTTHQRLKDTQLRLRALHDTPDGEPFTDLGETLFKPKRDKHSSTEAPAHWVYRTDGRRRNLTQEEHRAFWGWTAVEFLRPLLRVDPAQRARLQEIRDNLTARILEAEQHGWLGEAEGLRVSLAAAQAKLAQLDERTQRGAINHGIPTFSEVAGRTSDTGERPRAGTG